MNETTTESNQQINNFLHKWETYPFHLTLEDLVNTPSRKDGISFELETSQRHYACELIQRAGILLRK